MRDKLVTWLIEEEQKKTVALPSPMGFYSIFRSGEGAIAIYKENKSIGGEQELRSKNQSSIELMLKQI